MSNIVKPTDSKYVIYRDVLKPKDAKTEIYALVRDSAGRPKFDDINNIPGPIWGMLSDSEKNHILTQRKSAKTQE